ncbi:MAG: DUF4824 family protein [Woeseiaceae bacterium]
MNKPINKQAVIAAALLLLTNIIVLAGVAYNRSGDIKTSILLTERELSLPYRSYSEKENSGLALRLNWNVIPDNIFENNYSSYYLGNYGNPAWLTEDKQKELGVDVDSIKKDRGYKDYKYKKINIEEIIVVLEYDGESFKTVLKNAENDLVKERENVKENPDKKDLKKKLKNKEKSLEELKTSESRLIAIDAGLDLQTLRKKYNDSSKYLMLRGELRPYWNKKKLVARISQLFITRVHVSLPYSKKINEITKSKKTNNRYKNREEKPNYQVELKVGKRLEPWISGVKRL